MTATPFSRYAIPTAYHWQSQNKFITSLLHCTRSDRVIPAAERFSTKWLRCVFPFVASEILTSSLIDRLVQSTYDNNKISAQSWEQETSLWKRRKEGRKCHIFGIIDTRLYIFGVWHWCCNLGNIEKLTRYETFQKS